MSIVKNIARKFGLIAELLILKASLVTGVAEAAIDMPSGAVIDDLYLALDETFDPTGSAVIEAGIEGDTAIALASQNVFTGQALGGRAGLATFKGHKFTQPGAIWVKYTSGGGLATQGKARLIVAYHHENQADFVQN